MMGKLRHQIKDDDLPTLGELRELRKLKRKANAERAAQLLADEEQSIDEFYRYSFDVDEFLKSKEEISDDKRAAVAEDILKKMIKFYKNHPLELGYDPVLAENGISWRCWSEWMEYFKLYKDGKNKIYRLYIAVKEMYGYRREMLASYNKINYQSFRFVAPLLHDRYKIAHDLNVESRSKINSALNQPPPTVPPKAEDTGIPSYDQRKRMLAEETKDMG